MHQGLKDAFDTAFFPRIVLGCSQCPLRSLLSACRLFLDIQHIQFGAQLGTLCVGTDGEFPQAGLKLQNGVGYNQMTPDALPVGRLPCQQPHTEHQFVFLAEPKLLLMNGKESGIDLVDFLP